MQWKSQIHSTHTQSKLPVAEGHLQLYCACLRLRSDPLLHDMQKKNNIIMYIYTYERLYRYKNEKEEMVIRKNREDIKQKTRRGEENK